MRQTAHTSIKLALFAAASVVAVSSAPAYAADAPTATLQEVVVTANRTESLASKTAIALTAVTGDNLKSDGITNPTTLASVVPNLSIDRSNGLQITIRGVTSTDGTEKGDPSASFLLDGIYIARPQAQEVSFYDIDRVEVLRGPQGTLYGRNTTAGVVNVITAKPNFTQSTSVDFAYGNFNSVQGTAVTNIPLSDTLAVRAAINYDSRDSYITQGVAQSAGAEKFTDNTSGRLSALWKPTDKLTVLVKADASSIKGMNQGEGDVQISNFFQTPLATPGVGQRGVDPAYLNPGSSAALTRNYAYNGQLKNDDSTWGLSGEFTYKANDNWTLTYLGGYRKYDRDDVSSFYIGIGFPGKFSGSYDEQSHEARLAFANDRLKAQTGLYYFREHYGIRLDLFGLLAPNSGTVGYDFGFPQAPGYAQSFGVFGQGTYSLTDKLRITAGIRSTDDDKARHGATIAHAQFSDPVNFNTTDSENNAKVETSKTTWKLGFEYDIAPSVLGYGTASTGYKAGGMNDGCLATSSNCHGSAVRTAAALFYEPETLTAYEIGVKGKFLENTLRINADYFHYDYNNLQISQLSYICGGPCQVTSNAAQATVDGIEVEGAYLLNAHNRFDGAITWMDAKYAKWLIPTGPSASQPDYVDFSGEHLDRSPEFTVNFGYSHTMPLANGGDVVAGIHTKYTDKYALISTAIRAQFWQPGYSSTDMTLTYNAPEHKWYVQGYLKNLEDNIAVTYASVSGSNGTVTTTDPRTFGVRFGAKF